jgi:hypothetical protein
MTNKLKGSEFEGRSAGYRQEFEEQRLHRLRDRDAPVKGKPVGLKVMLAKPPPQPVNPSMISQLSKQSKPISLAKVWK